MDQLTQMESLQLHELLMSEELALKKCRHYKESLHDDELEPFVQKTIAVHREHLAQLVDLYRQNSGKGEQHS